ncbi:ROK family protein [Salinicoccus albus]|uniref:ROK family protein n=1 Tax=Salinicoccus albus TaxID=418756 RepID=UPI00035F2209|nr:ROK family protein [Salinicoccus albus]
MSYLTIDIGGTFIKYAQLDASHHLSHTEKVETIENKDNAILHQVEAIIQTSLDNGSPIKGVGISTAGIVDREAGEIIYAGPTIPNYKGTPFKKYLSDQFDIPVVVENDVNAALKGEMWKGAGSGRDDVFCITLGTGIGGAYYQAGLVDGAYNQANSVGYLLKDPRSGLNFEGRASTAALKRRIKETHGGRMDSETVFSLAKAGDQNSLDTLKAWAGDVAEGLAQIIILIDPKCLIIGGGISAQGDFLLDLIQAPLTDYLPADFLKTELKIAELYNDAALFGAVQPFIEEEK